jgi:hypothetical protein
VLGKVRVVMPGGKVAFFVLAGGGLEGRGRGVLGWNWMCWGR